MLWRIYDIKYIHNSEHNSNKELTKNSDDGIHF